jgi:hypothetical protein
MLLHFRRIKDHDNLTIVNFLFTPTFVIMMDPELVKLIERIKNFELAYDEVIKVLKGIGRREAMRTTAAFFGHNIRLHRLEMDPGNQQELRDTQQFLYSAFCIYYDL